MTPDWLRSAAYRGGALGLRQRLMQRQTLTVAMFHRVAAAGSQAARHADPIYTLSADLFAAVLRFAARHYAVVSLEQVLAAAPLPPHALLLTFDDGWQDFAGVALPLLRAARLPAVVFVAADALTAPEPWWWQEILLRALREGAVSPADAWRAAAPEDAIPQDTPPHDDTELALLLRWAALPAGRRAAALAPLLDADARAEGRQMLRPEQLAGLAADRVGIGGHGAAHLPLPLLADPAADLARCRAVLGPAVAALSFPHGRYDAASIAAARQAGFSPLFTSDPCLNAAPGGRVSGVLGRISIQASAIAGRDGRCDPARLAAWLMLRPVRRL